jgi:hypothetical protein
VRGRGRRGGEEERRRGGEERRRGGEKERGGRRRGGEEERDTHLQAPPCPYFSNNPMITFKASSAVLPNIVNPGMPSTKKKTWARRNHF